MPAASDDMVLEVPALLDGVRADRAVALLTGVSRTVAARRLVHDGRVRVDGEAVLTRSTPLIAGRELAVDLPAQGQRALRPEPDVAVAVVDADPDLIVVDKPAGLVVHPGAGRDRGTLAGGLLARYPDLETLVDAGLCEPDRPGIVHRLDRRTSGLLVVARTPLAYRSLTRQLADRSVERRYVALVLGELGQDRGVIDAPIGRSARTPTRMAVSAQGREARTKYTVLRRYGGAHPTTLVTLALETGRTHQIRVHLSAIGHPVVGDDRYGVPAVMRKRAPDVGPGRMLLHAYRLGLDHPRGGRRRWDAPLPDDLVSVLGERPTLPMD